MFELARSAPDRLRRGARRATESAAGLAAFARAGMLRPIPPKGIAQIARQARAGAKTHLLYVLNAERDGDRPAFVFEGTTITWRQAERRVTRLANHLVARGVRPGDGVSIMLPNRPEFLEVQAAALRVGAVTAFVNPRSPAEEVRPLLERTRTRLLVTHRPDVAGDVDVLTVGDDYERAVGEASEDDPVVPKDAEGKVVIFTSGTTGRPKGAVRDLSQGAVSGFAGLLRQIPFRHDDVHMVVCPLYHSSGSGFAAMAEGLANTLVIVERFSPEAFCRHVAEHRVTTTTVVPTMLHKLTRFEGASDYDLSSLRIVVCTGSPLREEVRAAARELLGDVLYDLYGATEMGWVTIAGPEDQRRKPGSVGRPTAGVDVRILDAAGDALPRGRIGEIWAGSSVLMESYLDDPDLDRERMRDGYASVRDVGYLDEDGYLYVVDRADDMIISGGVNVYPAEVEVVLGSHPAVSQAAVVGVPDAEWGQRIVAAVVPGGEADVDDLLAHVRERVSYAAVPKEIRLVDELPLSHIGKVDKRRIVAEWDEAAPGEGSS